MAEQPIQPATEQETEQVAHPRAIRTFVMRTGRMTPSQDRAFEHLWPRFGLQLEQGKIAPQQLFGRNAPITLEIGFGMGDSLLQMAQASPERDFIGIEVHLPGVGRLLNNMHKEGVSNIRVYQQDALQVLDDCVPDGSLDRVQLFFPDPWHKKKHNKRRMVQPAWVAKIAEKLRPGGLLHMATDWQEYAEHMLAVMQQNQDFVSQAPEGECYSPCPAWRPETKFERRGQRLGHGVWDLIYQKRESV